MKSILEILSFTGFTQGFLTGILALIHEKFNKFEFRILGIIAILMGVDCLSQSTLVIVNVPVVYWINNGNLFLLGPLFYFFVKAIREGSRPSRSEVILHLTPFIIIKTATLILGPTNLGEKILPPAFFQGLNLFLTIHGISYAIFSLFAAFDINRLSNHFLKSFTLWLAIVYTFGWVSSFIGMQLEWYHIPIAMTMWTLTYVSMLSMILVISVQLMLYSEEVKEIQGQSPEIKVSGKTKKSKYDRSTIKPAQSKRLIKLLRKALEEEKLYLDPELNRYKLAEKIEVSPHKLSQLLNHHLDRSFSEYINELRLDEAKKKLIDPNFKNYTILAIAYESGFKSKSSFQRLFKKHTGQTPSQYLKGNKDIPSS